MYFFFSKILAPLLKPFNFIIFFIIFFYLINLKLKKKIFKFIINFLIIIFISICIFPIGKKGIFYLEKNYIYQDKLNKVDNIIVLAGPEAPITTFETQKLNVGDGSERLIASVKLALDHPSAKIYYIGGDGKLIKTKYDETYVAKIFYKDISFDLNRVTFIGGTRNTIENLTAFKKTNNSNKTNILITSASHMKRSMIIAKHLDINFIPYAVDFRSGISQISKKNDKFSILNNYQGFDLLANFNKFNFFVAELLGIIAFKLFY